MITVYHINHTEFRNASLGEQFPRSAYTKVAEVDTDDLDVAYEDTNNIYQPWTMNDNVKAYLPRLRSTSVGDMLETKDGTFIVAMCGFTPYVEPV